MFKVSSFSLHQARGTVAIGRIVIIVAIVDNPLIHSRPHIKLHSSHIWPPNSPDLNVVDYKAWSVMQEQVYQTPIHDVNDLRQRLLDVWAALDQRIVDYFV